MLYAYTGSDDRMYLDFTDASTGRTLQVAPGGTYDIRVAPGRAPGLTVPPGDGRWQPVQYAPPESFTPPPYIVDAPLPPPIPGVDDPAASPVPVAPEGAPADPPDPAAPEGAPEPGSEA